uniref:Uncharacterized protein n=1 Tax=Oryza nivara TaxID=4536 RepID=A0A0E0I448_ORYNI
MTSSSSSSTRLYYTLRRLEIERRERDSPPRRRPRCLTIKTWVHDVVGVGAGEPAKMDHRRAAELMLLSLSSQRTRMALVGGNHTAARFCTR